LPRDAVDFLIFLFFSPSSLLVGGGAASAARARYAEARRPWRSIRVTRRAARATAPPLGFCVCVSTGRADATPWHRRGRNKKKKKKKTTGTRRKTPRCCLCSFLLFPFHPHPPHSPMLAFPRQRQQDTRTTWSREE
jgi:hypothetical protein